MAKESGGGISARPRPFTSGKVRPSAGSGGLLCEGLGERAAVVVAQALLKLCGGELAAGLYHDPFPVHPLGLDRVEPRALARRAPDQKRQATVALGVTVV